MGLKLEESLDVDVAIVGDAKPGALELGRADALNARTQQYLEVAGILDELLPQGITCNTSSTFGNGDFKSRQNKWWTSIEYALHKNFLMIGQPVVEQLLAKKLSTDVHYAEQFSALSEDESGVQLHTDCGRTIRCKYAIAADGARSSVRTSLDISFTGTKPEMVWAVLDTFIETDFPICPEIITFELNGQSRVSWIPRERGMARFYVLLEGEITQERAEESIRQHMAPHRVEFRKTEWFSTFEVKERIASTFVSQRGAGRIILAGDAAHVHSVNGGQGLNTGLADAFGLIWRLALALKHERLTPQAAHELVRSYDTERRIVAQGVIDVAAALVRDTVHTAKQYVSTIERNAGYITGMGVSYDGLGSSMICESQHGIWMAGRRCPDISLTRRGQTNRFYSMVEYGTFYILSIGHHVDLCDVATCLAVFPSAAGPDDAAYTSTSVTDGEHLVVVVRPDMYIGYVGQAWREYMMKLFL